MSKPYSLTRPCPKCPFRNDIRPYLNPERVVEIEHSLVRAEFPCHETVDRSSDDEDDVVRSTANEIHCAGALILLEKLERPSQMMRISERIGLYDPRKLDMAAPVFDSFEEMIEANESTRNERRTRATRKRAAR